MDTQKLGRLLADRRDHVVSLVSVVSTGQVVQAIGTTLVLWVRNSGEKKKKTWRILRHHIDNMVNCIQSLFPPIGQAPRPIVVAHQYSSELVLRLDGGPSPNHR